MEHSKDHLSGAADIGRRGGCTFWFGGIWVLLITAGWLGYGWLHPSAAADMRLPPDHYSEYRMGDFGRFGTYSEAYHLKRWKEMCRGGARYDAMREAYARGKPDPCSAAEEWRR